MVNGDRVHIITTNTMGMIDEEFDAVYGSVATRGVERYINVIRDDGTTTLVKPRHIRPARVVAPVELVMCDCGHSVHPQSVMHTSTGTSCPDCYDRMSY